MLELLYRKKAVKPGVAQDRFLVIGRLLPITTAGSTASDWQIYTAAFLVLDFAVVGDRRNKYSVLVVEADRRNIAEQFDIAD